MIRYGLAVGRAPGYTVGASQWDVAGNRTANVPARRPRRLADVRRLGTVSSRHAVCIGVCVATRPDRSWPVLMPGHGGAIPRGRAGRALNPRDAAIVALVGRFRLMTGDQIRAVAFPVQASKTPCDRALRRLTTAGYVSRLGRLVGGFGGGSGQYVYQLGQAGWRHLGKGGSYRPLRVVDLHTLTVAECFVQLQRLELSGECTVITYQPEPASRVQVHGTPLTPDAYVELGVHSPRRKFAFWLEIDRDTENPDTIRGKCSRYWRAYQAWDGEVFPYVLFVVPDETRQRELARVIAGGPDEALALFRVELLESFAHVIHRNLLEQG